MKQLLLCFIIILTISDLSAKEIANVDELIQYALKNAPDLKVSRKEYEIALENKKETFGYFLPKIDLQLSTGKQDSDNSAVNFLLGSISLQQLLYDFGKTDARYQNYKQQESALLMLTRQKMADKITEVKSAYYLILSNMALVSVTKENIRLTQAQLYRAKQYFKAGIRTKIDISDAKINLIKAKIDAKEALFKLKSSYENLYKTIGLTQQTEPYKILPHSLKFDTLYETITPYKYTLEQSIKYAYKNRYIIKAAQAQLKASHANKKSIKAQYFPTLFLNADYTKQKEDNKMFQEDWQASFNINWNIYEGGRTVANVQKSILQEDISKAQLELLKLQIKKEVTESYFNLQSTKERLELAQALLSVSVEKFQQAQKRYENGLSDYIELQQSRQEYISAKSTLIVEYYKYYDALVKMYHATATLPL